MSDTPKNDAAPSGNGAGVNKAVSTTHLTRHTARTPMPVPWSSSAPSGTSDAAAQSMAAHAPTMRERVFALIRECGAYGATDEEGTEALGIRHNTYTPRRGELVALGLVRDTGKRRATESGRSAAVWVAAEFYVSGEGGG